MADTATVLQNVKSAQTLTQLNTAITQSSAAASSSNMLLYRGFGDSNTHISYAQQNNLSIIDNTQRASILSDPITVAQTGRLHGIAISDNTTISKWVFNPTLPEIPTQYRAAAQAANEYLFGKTGDTASLNNSLWGKASAEFVNSGLTQGKAAVIEFATPLTLEQTSAAPRVFDAVELPQILKNAPAGSTINGLTVDYLRTKPTTEALKIVTSIGAEVNLTNGSFIKNTTETLNTLELAKKGVPIDASGSTTIQGVKVDKSQLGSTSLEFSYSSAKTGTVAGLNFGGNLLSNIGKAATIFDALTTAETVQQQINANDYDGAAVSVAAYAGRIEGGYRGAMLGKNFGLPGAIAGGIGGTVLGDTVVRQASEELPTLPARLLIGSLRTGVTAREWAIQGYNALTEYANKLLQQLPNCFAAGTPITMSDGTRKNIENIVLGDTVLAFDAQGNIHPKPVTNIYRNTTIEWLQVHLSSGETMHITAGHLVLSPSGEFTQIEKLIQNNTVQLITAQGDIITAPVQRIALDTPHTTYNFEVADLHTYIAHNRAVAKVDSATAN